MRTVSVHVKTAQKLPRVFYLLNFKKDPFFEQSVKIGRLAFQYKKQYKKENDIVLLKSLR